VQEKAVKRNLLLHSYNSPYFVEHSTGKPACMVCGGINTRVWCFTWYGLSVLGMKIRISQKAMSFNGPVRAEIKFA
jgi:hypothetical protein